jgi:hypothetical protein
MSGENIKHRPNNRRRFAQLLIIIGAILTVTGMILFFINTGSSYDDGIEQTIEEPIAVEEETVSLPDSVESSSDETETVETLPSTELSEEDSESIPKVTELHAFHGGSSDFEGVTFMMADGTIQQEGEGPAFHTVSIISTAVGINPKTTEDSDNLLVILSALPDREMSISVLVSVDQSEISGTNPDLIQGVQWILTYSGGEFKKTERLVTDDGMITQLAAEDFNIRFIGNEANAEIEFFGPLGTKYYAVMIYDEIYFTLIRP